MEIAVDGDGVLQRRHTGDDGDDPETKGAAAMGCGNEWGREISTVQSARYIYPYAVGGAELNNSVAPICVTARSITHRWLRDGSIR